MPFFYDLFDLFLIRLRQLLTTCQEQFDTVVDIRVVRRTDNYSDIKAEFARKISDPGCRYHSGGFSRRTDGHRSAMKKPLDVFAGFARVAARNKTRRMAKLFGQNRCNRAADLEDRRVVERIFTCSSPNSICSEKFAH